MDTPLQSTKQVASHFGGTRNGMVISWPPHLKKADRCAPSSSVIDIVPTILEATGIKAPPTIDGVKQKPIEGVSLVYTFDNTEAPTHLRRSISSWLATGASITMAGWRAPAPVRLPWQGGTDPVPMSSNGSSITSTRTSRRQMLSYEVSGKLKELEDAFDVEAKNISGLSARSSFASRANVAIRPSLTRGRTSLGTPWNHSYSRGFCTGFEEQGLHHHGRHGHPGWWGRRCLGHSRRSRSGGYALLVMNGVPEFDYAFSNQPQHKYRIASKIS